MQPSEQTQSRTLTREVKWLLYAASGLVFLAGIQLYVLTEQTAQYFAWTIAPPLTAAFLGGGYWASVLLEITAARQRLWTEARVAVPAVWLFTTLTLAATLLHFDRFHFNSPLQTAQAAAWLWLAIYAIVPPVMLVLTFLQIRRPSSDPARSMLLPRWLRLALIVQGMGMVLTGALLFLAPTTAIQVWPWTLTLLTARAVGAWLVAMGVAAVHAFWENDFKRIRVAASGYIAFGILELIAVARYPSQINWETYAAWVYLVFLFSVLPVGLYGWLGGRGTSSGQELAGKGRLQST